MDLKILVVDSDTEVTSSLEKALLTKGYKVRIACNGEEALKITESELVHLVITEVNLPELDGFSLCKTLRAQGFSSPIIFLTDKESEIYAVIGLEIGAQDYIRKTPLKINEVLARAELQLKVYLSKGTNRTIKIKNLEIDLERRTVVYAGKTKELTPKEFQILCKLAQFPKKVFSREELLTEIWGFPHAIKNTRTLDIHIGYLRKKIEEEPKRPKLFRTVRGVGYYLEIEKN